MGAMTDQRVATRCDECGVTDTHSKHHFHLGAVHPVTEESLDISRHITCCAAKGCGPCATDVEFAAAHPSVPDHTVPSDELTAFMQNKTLEHHEALANRHGISSVHAESGRLVTPAPAESAPEIGSEG